MSTLYNTASFRGDKFFLSNMSPCKIVLNEFALGLSYQKVSPKPDFIYPTVEHAYQSLRTTNHEDWMKLATATNPWEAKKIAKSVKCRPDWHMNSWKIMICLLYFKFGKDRDLAYKLINTGNEELREENYWRDEYWGIDMNTGKGLNYLGKMLMLVRKMLKKNNTSFWYAKGINVDKDRIKNLMWQFRELYNPK